MTKLNPCRRCGGKPKLIPIGDWKQYYVYSCSQCGLIPALLGEARLTEKGAREIWNLRNTVINDRGEMMNFLHCINRAARAAKELSDNIRLWEIKLNVPKDCPIFINSFRVHGKDIWEAIRLAQYEIASYPYPVTIKTVMEVDEEETANV